MPRFDVKMVIEFSGELEADTAAEAEEKAWTSWGDTAAADITYDGVYSIEVDEIEEDEEEEEDDEDSDES